MGKRYDEYFKRREIYRERNVDFLEKGVDFLDIDSVFIDENVEIGRGTVVFPNVVISGDTKIGDNCIIKGNSRIENSKIASGVIIDSSVILQSKVDEDTKIGPFAYLRPGSDIGKNCKIGDFVEVKNSIVEDGSKASHLTYIGDAEVGKNVNLGCGVVFVNYAPVKVGANSYVAAGSTVTKKVDPETLFVARSKGVVKRNWKLKNRSNVKK